MVKQKSTLRPSDKKNALELHQCLRFIFPQLIVNSHESWHFIFTMVYLAKKNAYSRDCFCFSLRVGIFPKDFPKEILNCESLWMLVFRITWIWIFGKYFEVNLFLECNIYVGKYTNHMYSLMIFFPQNDDFCVEPAPRWGNKPWFAPRKLLFSSF